MRDGSGVLEAVPKVLGEGAVVRDEKGRKAGQALIEWDNPGCDDHRCGNGHSRAGSLP